MKSVRREKILLRQPPQPEGEPALAADLSALADAMNSGALAREIAAANNDPELVV